MIQTERGASELRHEVLERVGARGAVALSLAGGARRVVERHALMLEVAMDAVNHVPAHAPEADEPELHQIEPPHRFRGVAFEPHLHRGQPVVAQRLEVAYRLRVLQVAEAVAASGISASSSPSCTSCTNRPVAGPPLCIWPVECRKRGP